MENDWIPYLMQTKLLQENGYYFLHSFVIEGLQMCEIFLVELCQFFSGDMVIAIFIEYHEEQQCSDVERTIQNTC